MNKRILIIEDNEEVRENIAEILELSNYTVVSAENGKKGVEEALGGSFDLIICDIMMPQLDGYGVLHLLGKHKETRDIPFIFLTAKSERLDVRKGMEMGADDYLTKPFDGIELLKAIEIRLQKTDALQQKWASPAPEVSDFIDQAGQSGRVQLTSQDREVNDYKKKVPVYSEGQRPKAVYYILKGKVKIYKVNNDGKELILDVFGPGDFFGYISILEGVNYRENAEVLEDAHLMLIPATDFSELITRDASIAGQFIKLISRNVLSKEEDLLNLAYNSLRKKVAYGLVQLSKSFRNPSGDAHPVIIMSRKEMAQAIGIATESFIRTIADFKEEGLIEIADGKILLLKEQALQNLPY